MTAKCQYFDVPFLALFWSELMSHLPRSSLTAIETEFLANAIHPPGPQRSHANTKKISYCLHWQASFCAFIEKIYRFVATLYCN